MKRLLVIVIIALSVAAGAAEAATVSGKITFVAKRGQNPNANETLIFPAVTNKAATVNGALVGKSFGSLVFQAGGYVIDGGAIKSDISAPFINNLAGTIGLILVGFCPSGPYIPGNRGASKVGTLSRAPRDGSSVRFAYTSTVLPEFPAVT